MKDQRVDVDIEANIAHLNTAPSDLMRPRENKSVQQINPYKFIGRIGLLLFIIGSAWVAFNYPLVWWSVVGGLFAAVGLLTLKERFTRQNH